MLSPWTRLTALKCAPLAHAERRDSHVYCLHMHVRARAPAFARVPVKNFSTLESLRWLGNGERVSFLLGRSLRNEQFWYFATIIWGKDRCFQDFLFCLETNDFEYWVRSFRPGSGGKFGEFWGKLITHHARDIFFANFLLISDII